MTSPELTLRSMVDPVMDDFGGAYCAHPSRHPRHKVLREALWGFHVLQPHALTLIDSPFFQRLRHLLQTSLAIYTYPSAVHSRFEHSLGVAHIAARMLESVERNTGISIPKYLVLETKLAALLHDISHGPFSHASEDVYGRHPVFAQLKMMERFADASASELQAWAMLTSPAFAQLWEVVQEQAGEALSVERVASMILGSTIGIPNEFAFLTDVVNGPFDADKLDYLSRDGYFTGLQIAVDTERLLNGLGVYTDRSGKKRLLVEVTSSSALEQVIFAKTQLFNQFYHHQKVRASARLLQELIQSIAAAGELVGGRDLKVPASFLALDENDVLGGSFQDEKVRTLQRRIRYRQLPKRALVLSYPTFERSDDIEDLPDWLHLRSTWSDDDSGQLRREAEADIARRAGVDPDDVMIDIPAPAKLGDTVNASIRLTDSKVMPLNEFFPAGGWAQAHTRYRSVSYIFTFSPDRNKVGKAAQDYLAERHVKVNSHAFALAKVENV